MFPRLHPKKRAWRVTDVITTSASQQTRVDFSVSNAKAREEGGREENCRLRSPCRATSIALVDTETGVLTKKVLKHEGMQYGSFTPHWKGRWWWAWRPPARCNGSWSCWKS